MYTSLVGLGVSLADLLSRNTIDYVGNKMRLAKEKKNLESQSVAYEEIINQLLKDKNESIFLATKYKEAYEQITISDEDIEYLQKTVRGAIQILFALSPQTDEVKASVETLIELLNKDTLKTMQLLGFNYKEAIGQPLTEVCFQAIKEKLKVSSSTSKNKKR